MTFKAGGQDSRHPGWIHSCLYIVYDHVLKLFKFSACGSINAPTDGSVSYSNDLLVESIATFTCNEGHVIAGLSQLVCLSSGAWSESSPTCPIVGK